MKGNGEKERQKDQGSGWCYRKMSFAETDRCPYLCPWSGTKFGMVTIPLALSFDVITLWAGDGVRLVCAGKGPHQQLHADSWSLSFLPPKGITHGRGEGRTDSWVPSGLCHELPAGDLYVIVRDFDTAFQEDSHRVSEAEGGSICVLPASWGQPSPADNPVRSGSYS